MGVDEPVVDRVRPRGDESGYGALIRIWILRLFSRGGAGARYARRGLESDDVASLLGYEPGGRGNRASEFVEWCRAELGRSKVTTPTCRGALFQNVQTLSESLDLSPVEGEMLAFKALAVANGELADVLHKGFGPVADSQVSRIIATALVRDVREIDLAMGPEGALREAGLLMLQPAVLPFNAKLLTYSGLISSVLSRQSSLDSLIGFATRRADPARLRLEDFPHLAQPVEILRGFLTAARRERLAGVNVLLHGSPGVGKTEFVKALAAAAGLRLYEVNMTGRDGESLSPQERLDAYRFNQKLFSRDRGAVALFDEIEDVFPPPGSGAERKAIDKAWLNRLLETNPVPAFWLSNRIRHIDPAHLRRFDYVLEMTVPPRAVRRRILADELSGLPVANDVLDRQADHPVVTPAVIERVGRVLRRLDLRDGCEAGRHLDALIDSHLEAQGQGRAARGPRIADYRLDLLNTSVRLDGLADRLQDGQRAALLLYGPPGTGKTAYAHVLARELDCPLLARRASELQSLWAGETEKNLARMFRDAEAERAVLLLDEADSFLQDRREAVRTWEVSQVNELLTQMEGFEGVFVCATNFLDRLDPASIRRFGLKVRFGYLTPVQRLRMLEDLMRDTGLGRLDDAGRDEADRVLSGLYNLTPGDFVAVRDQMRLTDTGKLMNVLAALSEESRMKPGGSRCVIGFV